MDQDLFADEIVLGHRRRSRWAIIFALLCMVLAIACVGAISMLAPLKETQAYVILVDEKTGLSERLTMVHQDALVQGEALTQALLVSYVTDREVFDRTGAEHRVNSVLRRSKDTAAEDWVALWSSGHEDYPPAKRDDGDRILVKVRNIVLLDRETAQVRFTKKLITKRGQREGAFVATVGFEFNPKVERSIEQVWENPMGFQVASYRVDAETLDGGL